MSKATTASESVATNAFLANTGTTSALVTETNSVATTAVSQSGTNVTVASVGPPQLTAEEQEKFDIAKKKKLEKLRAERLLRFKRCKRKCKQCSLLSMFILSTFMGIGGVVKWGLFKVEFSEPPSTYAEDSYQHAILAFAALTLLAPFGFIVLVNRISNMFVGMVFMFCIILAISFAMSGASRAGYSRKHDTLSDMKLFYQKRFREEKNVPEFYNRVQSKCKCCGFEAIDRLEDWPVSLKSSNFPAGCCKSKDPLACQGLGRMFDQPRIPSGFMIIMGTSSQNILENWRVNSNITNGIYHFKNNQPTEEYRIAVDFQNQFASPSLTQGYVRQESEFLFDKYRDAQDDTGPVGNSYIEIPPEKPGDPISEKLRKGVNILPSELLVRLDTFVDESIYYNDDVDVKGNPQMESDIRRGKWVAFEIPVKSPVSIYANKASQVNPFKSYYFTKGLLENILFDQHDLIWDRRCETKLKTHRFDGCDYHQLQNTGSRGPESLREKIRSRFRRNNMNDGLFVGILKQEMLWQAWLCGGVVFSVLLLSIVFWYYYSRLKLEEQANLTVPTDFDLLHLDLQIEDDNEQDKYKERELLEIRQRERRERIREEQQGHSGYSRRVVEPGSLQKSSKLPESKKSQNKPKASVKPWKSIKVAPASSATIASSHRI